MVAVLVLRDGDPRVSGAGMCWPTEDGSIMNVEECMGWRNLVTLLEPDGRLDFHRAIDLLFAAGTVIRSPISGVCSRSHETMWGFETASQLDSFELIDPFGSLAVAHGANCIELTAERAGVASFPADVARYQPIRQRIAPKDGQDWVIEINVSSAFPATGALGVGLFSPDLTQRFSIEYDGVTATLRGVGTTTFANDGATFAVSGATWLRVSYTASTDTYAWQHSSGDGDTFTTIASESGRTFTNPTLTSYVPTIYWRSADTNATPYTIQVSEFNWYDAKRQTSRFGVYAFFTDGTRTIVMQHFQSLLVRQGDTVSVGQPIGIVGSTGFGADGRIQHIHLHVEVFAGASAVYDTDLTQNPLGPGYFPHLDAPSVTAIRTRENSPGGVDSWRIQVTIQRVSLLHQGFTVNRLTVTGDGGERIVDQQLRLGLDPANNDTTPYDGVHIVGGSMDDESPSVTWNFYVAVSAVGTTGVSHSVADTSGVVVASG